MPSQGVHLFWWTPHASEHSKAKGAGKFALTLVHARRAVRPEARLQRGVGDDLIRLSVGLEDEADLLGDLEQSLNRL
ncbi:PLP-dependent transferase [Bradyrhizobium sp. CW9]|uniref:PLP-dependent transferase n=1 Tax=Bradyrhizobium sp. CW9 TaxID=2782689 RepID=UPI003211D796